MITEQGVVEEVLERTVRVRIEKSSACAACQSRDSCTEASGSDMIIEVANELSASEGDRIEISIPSGSFLTLSFLVYLFPAAALITGAVTGGALAPACQVNPTALSILGGATGIGATFYALRRLDRSARAQRDFRPRMTRIVRRSETAQAEHLPLNI